MQNLTDDMSKQMDSLNDEMKSTMSDLQNKMQEVDLSDTDAAKERLTELRGQVDSKLQELGENADESMDAAKSQLEQTRSKLEEMLQDLQQ